MRKSAFRKSGLLSLLLLGFACSMAFAQERTITGNVTSAEEGPIPGVNVVVQGTTIGAVTDIDGNYSITVPSADAILLYSSIGYTKQAIPVADQSVIDVVLVTDVTSLDEIVVIGYGTQKKKEVTSAIANVKSEDFNKGAVSNPAQLVQGKVAGLSITRPGGNPNQGFTMRLRGMSTIGANTEPLVVIDGVVGGSLNNLDPNDIESIDVLKDGSAAAIYGTRGSSGVIIVSTKKGRRGTARVSYNGMLTSESVAKFRDVMTASQWRAMSKETGRGIDFGENTNWFEETTQTALSQVHNLSLSGGSEKTTYMASLNYRDGDGVAINTGYSQLNGRLNLSQKALNDKLTLDLNIGATQRESQYGFDEAFRYASIYNPTAPVRSDDPEYEKYDGYFQQVLFDYYNPVAIMEQNINEGKDQRVNVALKGTYEVIDGLKVSALYSTQNETFQRGSYYDKNSYFRGMDRNGLASRGFDESSFQLFESTVNYLTDLGAASLNVMGGYSYQHFNDEGFGTSAGNFITDAFTYNNLGAAGDYKQGRPDLAYSYRNGYKLAAFFGRVNLNVSDAWFLTASLRYEGSSRFGAGRKWGLFPALAGGVDLARLLDIASMDNLKLRASYGVTGQLPASSYISLLRLGPRGNFFYNGEFIPGYQPISNANEDLGWEKKGEINLGLDFSLMAGKIYGSFDFYTRTTTDLLFTYEVPSPPNLYTDVTLNLGEIKNSGLELSLSMKLIESDDFSFTTTLTPTYYLKNELVSLSGEFNGAELNYGVRDLGAMGSPGQTGVPLVRAEEGQPIGQLWAQTFVEVDNDGNLILEDTNTDGAVDELDRTVVGNGLPKAELGWGNTFRFKNLDLNLFFRGVFGHDLINTFRGFYEVPQMIGSYNLPASADKMRSENGTLMNSSSGILSSKHVEDAGFFALDNASLGYTFDVSGSSTFSNLRVFIAGNNLFYITRYSGVDPSPRYDDYGNVLIPGIDRRNTWFRTRSVSVGINLGF